MIPRILCYLFYFFFPFLLLIVLFSRLFLRLTDLDKLASAHSKMLRPPMVCRLRLSVSCPLNISIIWWIISTSAIASPNMLFVEIHLIFEIMVYCDVEACDLINSIHYLFEFRAMPSINLASLRVSIKQIGMDHFMEKRLLSFIGFSELEKRFWQRNRTRSKALVFTGTCT